MSNRMMCICSFGLVMVIVLLLIASCAVLESPQPEPEQTTALVENSFPFATQTRPDGAFRLTNPSSEASDQNPTFSPDDHQVLFTRFDLSCGWDGHSHPQGSRVMPEDARRIGANMLTYCLANYQLGRKLAVEKVYFQDKEPTRDELLFNTLDQLGCEGICALILRGMLHRIKVLCEVIH